MHALGTLKSHRYTVSALHEITKATTMAQVMYAVLHGGDIPRVKTEINSKELCED